MSKGDIEDVERIKEMLKKDAIKRGWNEEEIKKAIEETLRVGFKLDNEVLALVNKLEEIYKENREDYVILLKTIIHLLLTQHLSKNGIKKTLIEIIEKIGAKEGN